MIQFDNTTKKAFATCPRYYHHFIGEGLRKKRVAAPLNFGAAVHKGIAEFTIMWVKGGRSQDPGVLEDITKRALASALMDWQEVELREDDWRTPQQLTRTLGQLIQWKTKEHATPMVGTDGEPLVEKSFALPMDSSELVFVGKIDEVQDCLGQITPIDYKTTSSLVGNTRKGESKTIPASFWEPYRMASQMYGYCNAVQQMVGKRITQFAIVGIGIDKYSGNTILEKQVFPVNPKLMDEWKDDYAKWAKNVETAKVNNSFPKNTDSCFLYRRACDYWSLCTSPGLTASIIENDFIVKKWNPLELEDDK